MRVVIQRVSHANVMVGANVIGQIGRGLCIFLGVGKDDREENVNRLVAKIKSLRIFEDDRGKMNRSVSDGQGEVLVVSQFTLYGDCRKGTRPSFTDAAAPAEAQKLYDYFAQRLVDAGLTVATGKFQAKMAVTLANDGPVTFILEA
jgi:D-tyrosyl-tRNA(Tyr) deacylase